MAVTRFYLDTRAAKLDGTYPLKIRIYHNGDACLFSVGVSVLRSQWDAFGWRIVRRPDASFLNSQIQQFMAQLNAFIGTLEAEGRLQEMTAAEVRDAFNGGEVKATRVRRERKRTFLDVFNAQIERKAGSRTQGIYICTLRRLQAFCPKLHKVRWEDITPRWLEEFDNFLGQTGPSRNYRNIHLRNIRAVFNLALDDEDTQCYPFRRFKIRAVPTRKRAMPVEMLRKVFACEVEPYAELFRDMFKLTFMLVGINAVDLYGLEGLFCDRVEYVRAKTHRPYSIKVEPEAMDIINKWRGQKKLLCLADRWGNHLTFLKHMNDALQSIGAPRRGRGGKKQLKDGWFPFLTSYWARHSWATCAAYLDIPKETIAAALGHGGNSVTDIYIDFDQHKVDRANRRVLDYVLYGKE